MTDRPMLVYSTNWYGENTFRMLPITKDCPFNEVIFDPKTKVLAIVSKEYKEKPQMFPKLNEKGATIPASNGKHAEQRLFIETYYEYYLDNYNDIKSFIFRFADNYDHPAVKVIEMLKTDEKS
jgi:hypothetical protein